MIKAIGSNVAQYVTVKTFVEALRKLVIEELQPQLLNAGRTLSETPPFPWSRPTFAAAKSCSISFLATTNSRRSLRSSLRRAEDVERFAKLPEQFGFAIEYTDNMGNLRYYEPDFVAVTERRHALHRRDEGPGGRQRRQQGPRGDPMVRKRDAADWKGLGICDCSPKCLSSASADAVCRFACARAKAACLTFQSLAPVIGGAKPCLARTAPGVI